LGTEVGVEALSLVVSPWRALKSRMMDLLKCWLFGGQHHGGGFRGDGEDEKGR
jgi:hypothetical protein